MKKFKGFTLIELIIVMAIMVILMAALMNMMKPIRSTYVDSTLYETQRNTQTGIVEYLSESTRYATDMGIYTKGKSATYTYNGVTLPSRSVTDVTSAVGYFLDDVSGKTVANNIANPTDKAAALVAAATIRTALEKRVQIITIDNSTSTYTFNGTTYTGRLIRKKGNAVVTTDAEVMNTDEGRLALGASYYGKSNYTINVTPTVASSKTTVKYTVASLTKSNLATSPTVITESEANCMNLAVKKSTIYNYGIKQGCSTTDLDLLMLTNPYFDTNLYDSTKTSTDGQKTYIVFLLPE